MRTDNLNIIKEILSRFEQQLDKPSIDWSKFSHEALGMSTPHWVRIMSMLSEEGLIRGFSYSGGETEPRLDIGNIRLTLRGLEYAEKIKSGSFDIKNLNS